MRFVIADRRAGGAGKGTIGRAAGGAISGSPHLDTGLLYRAVGVRALATGGA